MKSEKRKTNNVKYLQLINLWLNFVVRKAIKISESKCGTIAIYVDQINAEEILAFLNKDKRHQKKFNYIQEIIFGRFRMSEVYDKEEINQWCEE